MAIAPMMKARTAATLDRVRFTVFSFCWPALQPDADAVVNEIDRGDGGEQGKVPRAQRAVEDVQIVLCQFSSFLGGHRPHSLFASDEYSDVQINCPEPG
jgi:hypothetical protein